MADVLARYQAEYLAVPGVSTHWSAEDPIGAEATSWLFYEGLMDTFSPALLSEAIPLLVLSIIVERFGGAWAMAEADSGWEYAVWRPDLPELLTVSDLCSGRWKTEPPDEPITPESIAWDSFYDIEHKYLMPSNKRYRRRLERAQRYHDEKK